MSTYSYSTIYSLIVCVMTAQQQLQIKSTQRSSSGVKNVIHLFGHPLSKHSFICMLDASYAHYVLWCMPNSMFTSPGMDQGRCMLCSCSRLFRIHIGNWESVYRSVVDRLACRALVPCSLDIPGHALLGNGCCLCTVSSVEVIVCNIQMCGQKRTNRLLRTIC